MATRLEIKPLRASIDRASVILKREKKSLVQGAAKGFVKDIIAITPPGSPSVKGTAAKKQGEAAIQRDLAYLMNPVKRQPGLEDPTSLHQRFRSKRTGRVVSRPGSGPEPVDATAMRRLTRQLIARVGILASGWCAAADRLKVKVPAWIRRHSHLKTGAVSVVETPTYFRIVCENETSYVGNVKDYMRRVDKAVQYQAAKLDRQADHVVKKALKQAGF